MFNSKWLLVIKFVSISVIIIASAIGQQRIAYSKPAEDERAEGTASNKQSSTQQLGNTVATVSVGEGPVGIAVNPNTNMIYITNFHGNTTSIIEGKTNGIVKSIAVGKRPIGIAVNPNTNMIYVANYDSNTASVIDGKTNAVIKNIQTGMNPAGIAVNPNTNKIYLVTRSSNEFEEFGVYIIDGETNGIVKSIAVGKGPISIAVNPNTNMIYEANPGADTVSMIMTKFPIVR